MSVRVVAIFILVALFCAIYFQGTFGNEDRRVEDAPNERLVHLRNGDEVKPATLKTRIREKEQASSQPYKIRNYVEFTASDHVERIQQNLKGVRLLGKVEGKALKTIDDVDQEMAGVIDLRTRMYYQHSYFEKDGWIYLWGGTRSDPEHGYAFEMKTGNFFVWKIYKDKRWDRYLTEVGDYFFQLKDLSFVPQ